ncbi:MAG: UDP-N-acetylmuramate--L-alanine ligase [Xanthomonadales bacterium]|nr:UDP-N-acetylmuramate--L-alanine ligase [Xanthomonadales bacterium]
MNIHSGHLRPMRRIRRVHFVGVGGVGMNGIAEVLVNQGFDVSGSDLRESRATRHLQELGARIFIGHEAGQVAGVDVLVVSSAVPANNPEVQAAREARIPVVPRAEMLAELMRFKRGIAVAGTHGKTTTTSLAASLLAEAGMDPTFVIGGVVNAWGSNARLGQGDYLLAEADESDGSFLLLQPIIALITNIDRDHLESYEGSFENLKKAFLEFLQHLPFYGAAVLCIDDPEVSALVPQVSRAVVTFGLSEEADIRATDLRQQGRNMSFKVRLPRPSEAVEVTINLPGLHNVRNALGAIAVAWEIGLDLHSVVGCLREFKGVGRRFADIGELSFEKGKVRAIEDYGHHPSELEATIAAAREGWPEKRIVAVFQPHRYTRTASLFDEFSRVLSAADAVVLTDVYPAGETVIEGINSAALCNSIRARGKVDPVLIADVNELPSSLPALLQAGDLVLILGAGSIERIAQDLRESGFSREIPS